MEQGRRIKLKTVRTYSRNSQRSDDTTYRKPKMELNAQKIASQEEKIISMQHHIEFIGQKYT